MNVPGTKLKFYEMVAKKGKKENKRKFEEQN